MPMSTNVISVLHVSDQIHDDCDGRGDVIMNDKFRYRDSRRIITIFFFFFPLIKKGTGGNLAWSSPV